MGESLCLKTTMKNRKLRNKDLKSVSYTNNKIISVALNIMAKYFKHMQNSDKLELLSKVFQKPEQYLEDEILHRIAIELINERQEKVIKKEIELENIKPYKIYGREFISDNTIQQMEGAMQLPVSVEGALMPDAHHGYGLPIGSVLATKNAVIPYGVGMDIGCRMRLSIFEQNSDYLKKNEFAVLRELKRNTAFGLSETVEGNKDHEIFERNEFQLTPLLRKLKGKAVKQLGSSGSGNHFVEFGEVDLKEGNELGIPRGRYLGLLSHSGSRGLGASIAQYYTEIAMGTCLLPKNVKNMAWLDLSSEAGQEYWMSMNLAGDYAKACHDEIHDNLIRFLGLTQMNKVENHHNFAWKEQYSDGNDYIIHRKGATPAKKGDMGIIPGSMTSKGYIVSGKGVKGSLFSASHGAGRKMSRSKAKSSYTMNEMKKMIKKEKITLIGGSIDEAPFVYKDIEQVMKAQDQLVNIEGSFTPKIVVMDKK